MVRFGIIGFGEVGAIFIRELAARGAPVASFDVNQRWVSALISATRV